MPMSAKPKSQMPAGQQKTVVKCNFRWAGRISNEHARALTTIHESFARHLTSALDALLSTELEVKLSSIDQPGLEEHVAAIPAYCCIIPFSMRSPSATVVVECGNEFVFPLVDLLLGGDGVSSDEPRELSEIEDAIMQEVFAMIVRQAEVAWGLPRGAMAPGNRIKPAGFDQICSPSEKLTCLNFALVIGSITGSFQLVVPASLLNILLQRIKLDQPRKRTVSYFPQPDIRDRILDSDVDVTVELPGLKIAVKDLLALLPGSILKLRAPVRTPGMLVAGGYNIFEATPVRNGSRKAAQLGRRIAPANMKEIKRNGSANE